MKDKFIEKTRYEQGLKKGFLNRLENEHIDDRFGKNKDNEEKKISSPKDNDDDNEIPTPNEDSSYYHKSSAASTEPTTDFDTDELESSSTSSDEAIDPVDQTCTARKGCQCRQCLTKEKLFRQKLRKEKRTERRINFELPDSEDDVKNLKPENEKNRNFMEREESLPYLCKFNETYTLRRYKVKKFITEEIDNFELKLKQSHRIHQFEPFDIQSFYEKMKIQNVTLTGSEKKYRRFDILWKKFQQNQDISTLSRKKREKKWFKFPKIKSAMSLDDLLDDNNDEDQTLDSRISDKNNNNNELSRFLKDGQKDTSNPLKLISIEKVCKKNFRCDNLSFSQHHSMSLLLKQFSFMRHNNEYFDFSSKTINDSLTYGFHNVRYGFVPNWAKNLIRAYMIMKGTENFFSYNLENYDDVQVTLRTDDCDIYQGELEQFVFAYWLAETKDLQTCFTTVQKNRFKDLKSISYVVYSCMKKVNEMLTTTNASSLSKETDKKEKLQMYYAGLSFLQNYILKTFKENSCVHIDSDTQFNDLEDAKKKDESIKITTLVCLFKRFFEYLWRLSDEPVRRFMCDILDSLKVHHYLSPKTVLYLRQSYCKKAEKILLGRLVDQELMECGSEYDLTNDDERNSVKTFKRSLFFWFTEKKKISYKIEDIFKTDEDEDCQTVLNRNHIWNMFSETLVSLHDCFLDHRFDDYPIGPDDFEDLLVLKKEKIYSNEEKKSFISYWFLISLDNFYVAIVRNCLHFMRHFAERDSLKKKALNSSELFKKWKEDYIEVKFSLNKDYKQQFFVSFNPNLDAKEGHSFFKKFQLLVDVASIFEDASKHRHFLHTQMGTFNVIFSNILDCVLLSIQYRMNANEGKNFYNEILFGLAEFLQRRKDPFEKLNAMNLDLHFKIYSQNLLRLFYDEDEQGDSTRFKIDNDLMINLEELFESPDPDFLLKKLRPFDRDHLYIDCICTDEEFNPEGCSCRRLIGDLTWAYNSAEESRKSIRDKQVENWRGMLTRDQQAAMNKKKKCVKKTKDIKENNGDDDNEKNTEPVASTSKDTTDVKKVKNSKKKRKKNNDIEIDESLYEYRFKKYNQIAWTFQFYNFFILQYLIFF